MIDLIGFAGRLDKQSRLCSDSRTGTAAAAAAATAATAPTAAVATVATVRSGISTS